MRKLLGFLVLFVVASTASAADKVICPSLSEANSRLSLRLQFLMDEWEKIKPRDRAGPPGTAAITRVETPNLALAIANVVAERAKEEARIWLLQQLTNQICDSDAKSKPYFSNTCAVIKNLNGYPGPSLSLLRTQFKRDIYALPACYLYIKNGESSAQATPEPKEDFAIDAYIAEAALVAIYLHEHKNDETNVDAPSLGSGNDNKVETMATALVLAMTARLRWWEKTMRSASMTQQSCAKPTKTEFIDLLSQVKKAIDNNGQKGTPEAVLQVIKNFYAKRQGCQEVVTDIEAVSDTYYNAVRGNYVEAALTAANNFLCNGDEPAKYCSRLPLIGEVASAKTQADMESALDHAIEPVGFWRRKQSEAFWSLDAMVGVAAGHESLSSPNTNAKHYSTGLFLPVSIEHSWPGSGKWGSYAFGMSMLDLGAMLSYSKQSDTEGGKTSTAANTKLSSLIAPGIYLSYGFKDSPFRWGLSASRTPELRSVDFSGNTSEQADSTRYILFFAADITLFAI